MVESLIPDLSPLFSHFLAETLLCLAIPVIILADLFAGPERRERVATVLGLGALALAFLVAVWQPYSDGALLTKTLRADGLSKIFRVLAIGTGALAAVAAIRGNDVARARTEFFVCLIGAVVGACLTAAANDLAVLYLAIETLSISGYLLAGFRKDNPEGSEAAMKYVIFGAVSSGLMLYGMSLLYGFAGTATIATPPGSGFASLQSVAGAASGSPLFIISIVLVFAGLAYKIAAAPFQFWCPDVYQGAPTSVAAFLAVASKGAGFAAALRFVGAITGGGDGGVVTEALARNTELVQSVLLVMGVITITIGNVTALRQRNSKRLLAYSAIAHAGTLVLGLSVTNSAGATALIFYMVVYLFMTIGAFYIVAMVEKETNRTDIDAFEGLGFRAPFVAVCMSICLIGLAGLPPTAGFWGKVFIFQGVFSYAGETGSQLFFWGGVIGLLNSVVALFYYTKFLRVMFLCERDRIPSGAFPVAVLDQGMTLAMTTPVLFYGIFYADLYKSAIGFSYGIF